MDSLGKRSITIELPDKRLEIVVAGLMDIEMKRTDERMTEVLNYIQVNYKTVTLEKLSEKFYLSKPYLSKYIKESTNSTFGDIVKQIRMNKAKSLLKGSGMTVENISEQVGYQNVEHFIRLFKKAYGTTPVEFRNSIPKQKISI